MKFSRYREWGRLLYGVFRPYRKWIALISLLTLLSGTLEGIGINAIIPLFSFIGGAGAVPTDSISLAIAGFFSRFGLPYTARFLLLFMVLLFLGKTVFVLLSQFVTAYVVADFEKKTRQTLLERTFDANWLFLLKQKVGHLDQMLVADVAGSSAILNYLGTVLMALVNFAIYSALIINLSPAIVAVAFLYGLGIFAVFMPLLNSTKRLSAAFVGKQKELAHYANEHIIGAKVVKALGSAEPVIRRGGAFLESLRRTYLSLVALQNGTSGLLQFMGVFFIIGLFVFLYKTASFEFASFAVVVYALNKVFGSIQSAQMNLHIITVQTAHAASIARYEGEARTSAEERAPGLPFSFARELVFERVSFSYAAARRPALEEVSFSIKRGSMVGLIGPSGGGKTTVVDLLLLLFASTSGAIRLDGTALSLMDLRSWRAHVGYVSQDVFLLNDTIENNIRFYDDTLTQNDLVAAAQTANILDFIERQPSGWQTPVGERGNRLSGGERQRVALARALARRPEVLILDEATSALDHESEELIRESIAKLRGKTTLVVVAHRLSTIAAADLLVVLDAGRVKETGRPQELLKDRESYFSRVYHLV